ncbi:23733_t:CDS:2, partial [Dentiscutata erythropus]
RYVLRSFIVTKEETILLTVEGSNESGDAKWLKASWLKELDNSGMRLELPKEKNHVGGIKNPYAEFGNRLISPNISENVYTPVADIQRYLSKQPNNVDDNCFFIFINTSKNIYH